jgi:hypothetical protein
VATLELITHQGGDAGPVRDEAALVELATHHDKQVALCVEIAEA